MAPASAVATSPGACSCTVFPKHIGWNQGAGLPRFEVTVNGFGCATTLPAFVFYTYPGGGVGSRGFLGFGVTDTVQLATFTSLGPTSAPDASEVIGIRVATGLSDADTLAECGAVTFQLDPGIPFPLP